MIKLVLINDIAMMLQYLLRMTPNKILSFQLVGNLDQNFFEAGPFVSTTTYRGKVALHEHTKLPQFVGTW